MIPPGMGTGLSCQPPANKKGKKTPTAKSRRLNNKSNPLEPRWPPGWCFRDPAKNVAAWCFSLNPGDMWNVAPN